MNLIHNAAHVLPIRQSQTVDTDFYLDRYDWCPAKDIFMTKEQFARFFDVTEDNLDLYPDNHELLELCHVEIGIEFHGYKVQIPNHLNATYVVKVQYFPHNPAYEMLNFNLLMGVSNAN